MSIEKQRRILLEKIQNIEQHDFESVALDVFRFQAEYNRVFKQYLSLLDVDYQCVNSFEQIPFLPIQFFKNYEIKTGKWEANRIFTSSGTTSKTTSSHSLKSSNFYQKNARKGFEKFYGKVEDYCFLALLPSYLERSGSSLIFMADDFIQESKYQQSDFFLHDLVKLVTVLKENIAGKIPTVLIGVSFALLDLAEKFPMDLNEIIIMETGGMKGRRKELTRAELHQIFKNAFQVDAIHSEYGMTELFSQGYSKGEGLFYPASTMRAMTREVTDPLQLQKNGRTGVLNIVDLGNLDTCSFIATDDLGKVYEDGSFEVLGRLDASDIRGCNLLVL